MKHNNYKNPIPDGVIKTFETIEKAGFETYLVGGCVRDILLGREPKDWDITTNAKPEDIVKLFPKTVYENKFGTVAVINENIEDEKVRIIEVTPYRIEGKYSDFRHPDEVKFGDKIEEDLKRRDFTINSMAINLSNGSIKDIVDLYGGIKDIKDKKLRSVGNADTRFNEDALRMLRCVRLHTEIGFEIEGETRESIIRNKNLIKEISQERIRDEFIKIIMSKEPKKGIYTLDELGLLEIILPELHIAKGVTQNQAHSYDVYEHLLVSLQHAADKDWPLEIRLSALFHDISKPETKRISRETGKITFYNHEMVGSRVTRNILERLKMPSKIVDKVVKMIRWHMFFSDTESITLSAVRRMINNVGKENIWDLMDLRVCDRVGTGRPKENPYRLRKYRAMIEEALRDPITVSMLKIDGKRIMEVTHETPGPKIGYILNALLEEVLDDPKLNNEEYLEEKALNLIKLPVEELKMLGLKGKEKREEIEKGEIGEISKKYHVS